jgi:hypothetical protein
MPFTSTDTPLAYLFLPQKGTQGRRRQQETGGTLLLLTARATTSLEVDHENTFHSGVDLGDGFRS